MRNITFTGLAKGGDSDRLMRRPMRFDTGIYGDIQSNIKDLIEKQAKNDSSKISYDQEQQSDEAESASVSDPSDGAVSSYEQTTDLSKIQVMDEELNDGINYCLDLMKALKFNEKIITSKGADAKLAYDNLYKALSDFYKLTQEQLKIKDPNKRMNLADYTNYQRKCIDAWNELGKIIKKYNIAMGKPPSNSDHVGKDKKENYHITTRTAYNFATGAFESDYVNVLDAEDKLGQIVDSLIPTEVAETAKGTDELDQVVSNDDTVQLPDGKESMNTRILVSEQKPFYNKKKENYSIIDELKSMFGFRKHKDDDIDDSIKYNKKKPIGGDQYSKKQKVIGGDQYSKKQIQLIDVPDNLNINKDATIPRNVDEFTITGNSVCYVSVILIPNRSSVVPPKGYLVIENGSNNSVTVSKDDSNWKLIFNKYPDILGFNITGFAIWDVNPGVIPARFVAKFIPKKEAFTIFGKYFDDDVVYNVILGIVFIAILILAYKIFWEAEKSPQEIALNQWYNSVKNRF